MHGERQCLSKGDSATGEATRVGTMTTILYVKLKTLPDQERRYTIALLTQSMYVGINQQQVGEGNYFGY